MLARRGRSVAFCRACPTPLEEPPRWTTRRPNAPRALPPTPAASPPSGCAPSSSGSSASRRRRPSSRHDIREVYAEAKGEGYDVKVLRRIVTLRKKDPAQRREEEELLELYLSAIGE